VKGDFHTVKQIESRGAMLDLQMYSQILFNIFMNACKFGKPKGTISISVSVRTHIEPFLGGDGKVLLDTTITDDGQGMDEE